MRLTFALFIIVLVEAKKKRPTSPLLESQDDIPQRTGTVNIFPGHFQHPVPFGHVFKDGFGDLRSNLKQPFDVLELDMVRPRTTQEAKEIWEKNRKNIQLIRNDLPKRFASPRDQYLYEQQHPNEKGVRELRTDENKNGSRTWIDWEAIQHLNVGKRRPFFRLPQPKEQPNEYGSIHPGSGPKSKYFASNSFDLTSNMRQDKVNWTNCDEFGKSPNFHPKDVVNIDWVPFFVWTTRGYHEAVVHRFSYPTKRLVKQYKDNYGAYLNKSIDWEQPKLVLREFLEMLLIAGDRTGLFYGVPHLDVPPFIKNKPVEFPILTMRLKIQVPYLALMHCENQFAAIMAVAGNEPTTDKEKFTEAATLKFRGAGYPVYRDLEKERMRSKAESEWLAQRKENEVLKINEPIIRDHFLGRDFMK